MSTSLHLSMWLKSATAGGPRAGRASKTACEESLMGPGFLITVLGLRLSLFPPKSLAAPSEGAASGWRRQNGGNRRLTERPGARGLAICPSLALGTEASWCPQMSPLVLPETVTSPGRPASPTASACPGSGVSTPAPFMGRTTLPALPVLGSFVTNCLTTWACLFPGAVQSRWPACLLLWRRRAVFAIAL